MSDDMAGIADRVRGVASEKRVTQERIAGILRISRQSVSLRITSKVPFQAHELLSLAVAFGVPITRFYPAQPAPSSDVLTPVSPGEGASSVSEDAA